MVPGFADDPRVEFALLHGVALFGFVVMHQLLF